jgi:hypothetical protein
MKHIKVIAGLGLIPLGVFIGSFISLGTGNGAILGGVLGIILSCIIWFVPQWSDSIRLDEQNQMNNADKQWVDMTVKGVHQAHIENELRSGRGTHSTGF